jgi:CRP/FNR family cyclic AMP-dependent transcriptional regulator
LDFSASTPLIIKFRCFVVFLLRLIPAKAMKPAALWYFESVNLFKILCPTKFEAARTNHTFRTLKKNEYVYFEGEGADEIYFVSSGRVKIFEIKDKKEEVVKSMLSAGEIFGELAIADEERRTDFAQAVENNTVVCCLKLTDMKQLVVNDKTCSFSILKLIGFKLHKLERKIEQLVFKDVRTRVVEFLKDAAEWKGKKVGTETLILTPLTHKEMGKLIGLSRQSVTATLNQLKDENKIYFDRKRILIRDLNELK